MGGVSRNLIGSITVLLVMIVALGFAPSHPWMAGALGAMGVFRLVVLVRQWNLGRAQATHRRPPPS